jgi:hypothetical protein
MFGRTKTFRFFGLSSLMALVSVSAALAGGFGVLVEIPSDRTDPRLKNAVLLVRAEGCHGPGSSWSATAEGIVKGRRQSIPLRLTKIDTELYAVKRQWPAEGVWVLALTGRSSWGKAPNGKPFAAVCRAMVELGPRGDVQVAAQPLAGGRKHLPVRYVSAERREIETALQALANKGTKSAAISRSVR